jgi:hypothetical protein
MGPRLYLIGTNLYLIGTNLYLKNRGKDACLILWAHNFTLKIYVKKNAYEVKGSAHEVKSCAQE